MTPDNGFVDLRLNAQDGQNQESFWPSFTDIMTVIVMIFMIAMVVLLLRNMELVRQLRATMAAERSAMELARSTGQEKEHLAMQLIAAENELSKRRLQQLQLDEKAQEHIRTITDQADLIARLTAENATLTLRRERLIAENKELDERLERSGKRVLSLQQDQRNLQQDLVSTRQRLDSAQTQLAGMEAEVDSLQRLREEDRQALENLDRRFLEQSRELQETRSAMRHSGFQLNTLQTEYDDLKLRYNELFRPARSPQGHYLVEVRYSKVDGSPKIEYATQDEPGFVTISRSELESRLTALKAAREEGLYIKVIFPENSGLAYNEAWRFTSELHARYDYYSQGQRQSGTP